MIKKLQKLKAKKGFTLVELIVVIAIIGVLAAILIPTMIGYVKSSNITAADQVAASIRKAITNTITDMETKSCTLKGDGYIVYANITNTSGADPTFGSVSAVQAAAEPKLAVAGKTPAGAAYSMTDNMLPAITATLEKDLKEIKAGACVAFIKNGVCVQVAYSSDNATITAIKTQIDDKTFTAENCEEGMIKGVIVGTNPKVTVIAGASASASESA